MKYVLGILWVLSAALGAGLGVHAVHAADEDVPQLAIILTYVNGELNGGDVMGTASSVETCQRSIAAFLATLTLKDGVETTGVCTPLPPPPAGRKHQPAAHL